MPRLNRLCRLGSNWLKSHAIERRRFAQQDEHHTHKLFCVRKRQANRNGRPNKQKNGFEMHIGYENPSHRKPQTHKKLACSTSMHCFVILQTEIENKLWFIHQNNGHDDRHCKTIRRKTSAKPKLKNKTDSMGFKHTPCIIIRNNPSHRTILWMRTGWQRNSKFTLRSPWQLECTNNASVTQPALPWFNNDNAERWKILQTTTINFTSQTERTFYDHFLRERLTESRSDSSELANNRERMQHCAPKTSIR